MLRQIKEGATVLELFRLLTESCQIVDGKILDCTFVVADGKTKRFAHGLGRAIRGAIVCGSLPPASSAPWTGAPWALAAGDPQFIDVRLPAASDVTVRLWVF